ncbi:MAG: hypothetical protein U0359_21510 [Byssovorax sp.]
MSRRAALAALLALPALGLSALREARAEALTPDELARLAEGEVVRRKIDLEMPDGPYFGGISYAIVDAPVADVMAVLLDPVSYRSILALTVESKVIGRKGDNMLLYLRQGSERYGTAEYTVAIRRESPGLLRFWLDPDYPHEIADMWGYFRATPHGAGGTKSMLTYAALVRLDPGLVRMLFSEKIRSYALNTPALVRAYLAGKRGR